MTAEEQHRREVLDEMQALAQIEADRGDGRALVIVKRLRAMLGYPVPPTPRRRQDD